MLRFTNILFNGTCSKLTKIDAIYSLQLDPNTNPPNKNYAVAFRMSDNEESRISLAPYIKSCEKVMKLSGCVWYWCRRNYRYERFTNKIFQTYFFAVMIFLVITTIYMLTNDEVSSSRQFTLTLTIVNNNLQILLLYVKREAFSRLIQDTPQFANKRAIEVQLKHAMKIIKPWAVIKGLIYFAIFTHNFFFVAQQLRNNFEEEVLVKVESNADFYGSLHIAGFVVRLMRVYTLTTMFVFQFGLSWLLMTVLIFINGYLNHLKLCLLRVKIRDPLAINVSWIDDYDLANGDYDMRYCVTMHQFIIRYLYVDLN